MPEPVTHAKLTEIAEKFGREDAQALISVMLQSVAYVLVDIREELSMLREAVARPSDYHEMTPAQAARFKANLDAFIESKRTQGASE